jgi:hypothetical protein
VRGRAARRTARPDDGPLARHLGEIARALSASLEDELAPVILAGPAALRSQYRSASDYPALLEDGLDLASGPTDLRALHSRALRLIRLRDADVHGALLARLESALPSGAAELDLRRIARAAAQGRVGLLLHGSDVQLWGRIDRQTGELDLHDRQRDDQDGDIVDDLAEMVLIAGGDVHELPPGMLPPGARIAAIYR